jgi:hypothetical protein
VYEDSDKEHMSRAEVLLLLADDDAVDDNTKQTLLGMYERVYERVLKLY